MNTHKNILRYVIMLVVFAFGASTQAFCFSTSQSDWTMYPSYTTVTKTVKAGDKLFVLASGNLFSYVTDASGNYVTGTLKTYTKADCLNDCDISYIAYAEASQNLVIVYSDKNVDILSSSGSVTNIADIMNSTIIDSKTINSLNIDGDNAYLSTGNGIIKISIKQGALTDYYRLGFSVDYSYVKDGSIYAASKNNGLYRCLPDSNPYNSKNWTFAGSYVAPATEAVTTPKTKPDGPYTNDCYSLALDNERIYVAPGLKNVDVEKSRAGNVFYYNGTKWGLYQNNIASKTGMRYLDINCVAVDPLDREHVFAGGKNGLFEFRNALFVKDYRYGYDGVPFETSVPTSSNPKNWGIINGMVFNKQGDLYVLNNENPRIAMLDHTGNWQSWDNSVLLGNQMNGYPKDGNVDSEGRLWYVSTRWKNSRVIMFNPSTEEIVRFDNLDTEEGLSYNTNSLYALAIDSMQNVLIGSAMGLIMVSKDNIDKGNYVYSSILKNSGTDGMKEPLIGGMQVFSIAVDSKNRKWIGTLDYGVYVVSSDNKTILQHYTKENSPLPSNIVTCIAENKYDGRVYFATSNGLCSLYIGSDISSEETVDQNVSATPNPVVPSYTGSVSITGLSAYSHITIQSPEGEVVSEGDVTDGAYSWDILDNNSKRCESGVYKVYSDDNALITKIKIIK